MEPNSNYNNNNIINKIGSSNGTPQFIAGSNNPMIHANHANSSNHQFAASQTTQMVVNYDSQRKPVLPSFHSLLTALNGGGRRGDEARDDNDEYNNVISSPFSSNPFPSSSSSPSMINYPPVPSQIHQQPPPERLPTFYSVQNDIHHSSHVNTPSTFPTATTSTFPTILPSTTTWNDSPFLQQQEDQIVVSPPTHQTLLETTSGAFSPTRTNACSPIVLYNNNEKELENNVLYNPKQKRKVKKANKTEQVSDFKFINNNFNEQGNSNPTTLQHDDKTLINNHVHFSMSNHTVPKKKKKSRNPPATALIDDLSNATSTSSESNTQQQSKGLATSSSQGPVYMEFVGVPSKKRKEYRDIINYKDEFFTDSYNSNQKRQRESSKKYRSKEPLDPKKKSQSP